MPDRLSTRSLRHASEDISVAPLASLLLLLPELGVDAAGMLRRVGVEPRVLHDATNRLPLDVVGRLIAECAAATACPHFGLLLGMRSGIAALGRVARFSRDAKTVGDGLRQLIGHLHLHNRGGMAALTQRDHGSVEFSYIMYHPNTAAVAQFLDHSAAVMCAVLRDLCGPRWAPSEVMLTRRRPPFVVPYRAYFRAPIRFDAPRTALVFPAACLEQPLSDADRTERAWQDAFPREFDATNSGSTADAVTRVLGRLLIEMPPSGDAVALRLGVEPRRLRERLNAEGMSIRQLLEDIRFELARQLLEETCIPIGEISADLHYSTPGAFSRAFKGWSGKTPRQWRQDRNAIQAR